MSYKLPKTKDYGANLCEGCFDKQREIDQLKEEIQQLRLKVYANQRKSQEGFFGSSTSSSQHEYLMWGRSREEMPCTEYYQPSNEIQAGSLIYCCY